MGPNLISSGMIWRKIWAFNLTLDLVCLSMEADLHSILIQIIKMCQKIEEITLTLLKLEVLVRHQIIIELMLEDLDLLQIIMQPKQEVLAMWIIKEEVITLLLMLEIKKGL
jgi:hypothetical protein